MSAALLRHPFVVAALALGTLLLAVIGWESGWGRAIQKPLPELAKVDVPPKTSPLLGEFSLQGGLELLPETVNRPVFNPVRKPPPPPPPPEPPKRSIPEGVYSLVGTTSVGDKLFAYVFDATANKVRYVEQGKEINGITVQTIERTAVTLKLDDDVKRIDLQVAKSPAGVRPGTPFPVAPGMTTPGVPPPMPVPGAQRPAPISPTPGVPPTPPQPRSGDSPTPNPPPPPPGSLFDQIYQRMGQRR